MTFLYSLEILTFFLLRMYSLLICKFIIANHINLFSIYILKPERNIRVNLGMQLASQTSNMFFYDLQFYMLYVQPSKPWVSTPVIQTVECFSLLDEDKIAGLKFSETIFLLSLRRDCSAIDAPENPFKIKIMKYQKTQ